MNGILSMALEYIAKKIKIKIIVGNGFVYCD